MAGVDDKDANPLASSTTARNLARKLIGDRSANPHLVTGFGQHNPQILDLAALRKAMGASWPSYGELIHRIAERMLHRHLGGAYEYTRVDDRYVVLFRGLSEPEGRRRIERIANSLAEFLFGSGTDEPDPLLGRRRYPGQKRGGAGRRWRAAMGRTARRYGRRLRNRYTAIVGGIKSLLPSRGWSATMASANHATVKHRPPTTARTKTAASKAQHAASRDATREPATDMASSKTESLSARARSLNTQRRGTLRKDLPDSEAPEHIKAASARAANRSTESEPPAVLAGALPTRSATPASRGSGTAAAEEPPAVLAGSLPSKPVQPALAAAQAALAAHETAAMEAAMARAVATRTGTPSTSTHERPASPVQPKTAASETTALGNPDDGSTSAKAPAESLADPKADAKAVAKTPPANAPRRTQIEDLQFLYRPMWSVRTNMLAISTCLPANQAPSGELLVGEAVMPPAAPLEFIEKLDRAVLENAINDCLAMIESGRSMLISVPVHAETLTDKERRAAYLEICRALPAAARRRLIFECLNIDRDVDHGQVVTALMNIKPYATLLIGQLSLRSTNFALWKRAGLGSVGIDMASTARAGTAGSDPESKLIGELQQFAFQAAQQGLRPYVRSLGTLSLAAAAVSAGFDFIEGSVIQAQAKSMDVQPFTLEDLYLQYAITRRARVSPGRLLNERFQATPGATAPQVATGG